MELLCDSVIWTEPEICIFKKYPPGESCCGGGPLPTLGEALKQQGPEWARKTRKEAGIDLATRTLVAIYI